MKFIHYTEYMNYGLIVMALLILLSVLGGCMATVREPLLYTQSEVDAINARTQCRTLARNLVQIARCDAR